MYRDCDFDPQRSWLSNETALTQDLELNTLFQAMAGTDEFLLPVVKQGILSGLGNNVETILYRQAVLQDCLKNESVVRNIYAIAIGALERKRANWLGVFSHYPSGILYDAVRLLQMLMEAAGKLKVVADEQSTMFASQGFNSFFNTLKAELSDDYFGTVKAQLKELEFREGVLMSAGLGEGNQGMNYVLRKSLRPKASFLESLFSRKPPIYKFHIDPRDEGGCRALTDLQDHGINLVANAVAQSADHVLDFFMMLRTELAFYIGCMNLHRLLREKNVPLCFPNPAQTGTQKHSSIGLRDVCLILTTKKNVVGNDLHADGKALVLITGANQGGKSTFLRGIGLAQLMMQSGMFVSAESFSADIRRAIFTHYKREEDASMKSGKFDEELNRMSGIVDSLTPGSLLLFNESFAATNEREGSEIATQIVRALLEAGVKVFFVTHLYEFAHGLWERQMNDATFLRAQREDDGQRTFKLVPGEPLETSFGTDLYKEVFEKSYQPKA